jgi:DNA-binding winged helix-turn-helix (wHTH) protein
MIRVGRALYDRDARTLRTEAGAGIALRPQSVRVLECLIDARGRLLGKRELLSTVWGPRCVTDDSLVQCVREIRVAIGDRPPRLLQTVRGEGYRLALDATRLRAADAPTPDRRPAATDVDERAVAVLPSDDDVDPDGHPALGRRLAEALEVELARHLALRTVPRRSVHAAARLGLSSRGLGEALGARYLVDGRIERRGTMLDWQLQVVDGPRDRILFVRRASEASDDPAGTVDALASRMASLVLMTVREHRWRGFAESACEPADETSGNEAERALGRLSAGLQLGTPESVGRALDVAERLVRALPGSAPVWSLAARAYLMDMELALTGRWTEDRGPEMVDAARRAIALDRSDALAHGALARALCCVGEFDAARAIAQRAVEMAPGDLSLEHFRSAVLFHCDRFEEAARGAEDVLARAPLRYHYYLAAAGRLRYLRDPGPAARAPLHEAVALLPSSTVARLTLVLGLHELGDRHGAAYHASALRRHAPGFSLRYFGPRWARIAPVRDRYLRALRACDPGQAPSRSELDGDAARPERERPAEAGRPR